MSEVNIYQQRRFLLAAAMIKQALELLDLADPEILDEVGFDQLIEVEGCVVGLLDARLLSEDYATVTKLLQIDPDTINLTSDIVGTEFEDQ